MRAITIRRPWTDAILHGGKDWENRSWKIPRAFLFATIALHAGNNYEKRSALFMRNNDLYLPPEKVDSPTGIVGVVKFDRMANESSGVDSPWFCGPFGWHISKVCSIPDPVACRGALGLWNVPKEISDQVMEQVRNEMRKEKNGS